jgi:hypothetical protein
MEKFKKKYFIGFFAGLFSVLIIEFTLNHDKYIDAFNKGYEKAHQLNLNPD